jgi:hypothetical protein
MGCRRSSGRSYPRGGSGSVGASLSQAASSTLIDRRPWTAPSVFDKHERLYRVIITKSSLLRFNLPIGTETTIWAPSVGDEASRRCMFAKKARRRAATGGRSKKAIGGRREVRKRRHRPELKLMREEVG